MYTKRHKYIQMNTKCILNVYYIHTNVYKYIKDVQIRTNIYKDVHMCTVAAAFFTKNTMPAMETT